MIDEKKIEKAAIKCYNKMYEAYGYVETDTIDAFKYGVTWALQEFKKSLWHDPKEEPRFDEWLILDHGDSDLSININGEKHTWENKVDILEINRWCYTDDILPEEGGEQ